MSEKKKKDAEEQMKEPQERSEKAAGAADEPQQMSEEDLRQKLEQHFRAQSVPDVLMQFLISLSTLAYVKMGLTDDTSDFKDLDQSRLAIDAFKSILDTASSKLPEQDAQALAGALASMQITFARATESGAEEAPGSPEPSEGDASA
jgi:hypothetical protein